MKALKIIGIVLLIIGALLGSLLWYASVKYEEILKTVVLSELNSRLKTEMKVESLDVSPFTELPFVSLNFQEVFISSSKIQEAKSDTLAYLSSLSLHFNVFDLLNEDFRARKISLAEGLINIEFDAAGLGNTNVIKAQDDSLSSPFLLKLEAFKAKNVHLIYRHKRDGILVDEQIHTLKAFGKISDSEIDAALSGAITSKSILSDKSIYLEGEKLDAELNFYFNLETNQFELRPSTLDVSGSQIEVQGNWSSKAYSWVVQSNEVELNSVYAKFPNPNLSFLESAKGKAELKLKIQKSEKQDAAQLDLDFKSTSASYRIDDQFELSSLKLEGSFTNGNRQNKNTSEVNLVLSGGKFNGNPFSTTLKLQNFAKPSLRHEGSASLNFVQLSSWTALDSILETTEGNLQVDFSGSGTFKKLDDLSLRNILLKELEAQIDFKALHFSLNELEFGGIDGSMQLNGQKLNYEASGELNQQELETKGLIVGLIPQLYGLSSKMKVETEVFIDGVDMQAFNSDSDDELTFGLPKWIWLNAKVRLNSFEWNNFLASNVSFDLQHRPSYIRLNELQMSLAKGDLLAQATLIKQDEYWQVSTLCEFKKIDVKALFFAFNQFGQNTLEDRHLEGILNGSANVEFTFIKKLAIQPESIFGESDFSIYKGRLLSFEPFDAVADYFASNFILKRVFKADDLRKEMQDIHFDTLTNTLLIRDEQISLPKMRIKSSVLDLDLDGTYNFKDEVDFHLDFYITDLMSRSSSESEFGEIEDDGTGRKKVFLLMSGNIDEPEFSLDKERKKEERKKKVQSETKVLKELIKEKVIKGGEENLDLEEDFEIDWSPEDEQEKKRTSSTNDSAKTGDADKQAKGLKGLLKKLKQGDTTKSEWEFDFEDDDF